jgi:uncharacterized protein (DUF2164 family)
MRIFETTMRELRLVHDSENLRDLVEVSERYCRAEWEINQLEKRLAETLSKENMEIINKMHDNFTTQETVAGEIHYNQGFSDAIKFIMQSLAWEPVKR